jgi:hypothetical protein
MRDLLKVAGVVLMLLLLFWAWYMVAADYGYKAVSGTYTFRSNSEGSTLVLQADRTFQQDLIRSRIEKHTQGTWRRIGEGGVVFSPEFLTVDGQERDPNGEAYANVEKGFLWLFVRSINLRPEPGGPKFYHKWIL